MQPNINPQFLKGFFEAFRIVSDEVEHGIGVEFECDVWERESLEFTSAQQKITENPNCKEITAKVFLDSILHFFWRSLSLNKKQIEKYKADPDLLKNFQHWTIFSMGLSFGEYIAQWMQKGDPSQPFTDFGSPQNPPNWQFWFSTKGERSGIQSLLSQQDFRYDFPIELIAIGPSAMFILLFVWGD